jgi:TM2 domain-containing membrane protein YozV
MKQKRKNRFFTFIFSCLPGAAEMYMGFMKNGLTLMIFFFLSFVPIVFFSSFEFLMALGLVIWFFGFFHARNYASMTDAEFDAMEDRYIWEEFPELGNIRIANTTVKKVIAAILIILGCGQLWRYFSGIIYNLIPQNIWNDIYPVVEGIPSVAIALLFITVGVLMVRGKKRELDIAPTVEIQRISEITPKQEEKPEVVADSETKEA